MLGTSLRCMQLGLELPVTVSDSDKKDENFLRAMQTAVLDVRLQR